MRVGRGSVYKPKTRGKPSPFWWIKWYRDGRPFRESSGSSRKTDAQALLARRLGDVSRGAPITPQFDRLTFDEAAADVVNDYKTNAKRSLDGLERRLRKHLQPYFAGRRMVSITASDARAYIAKRQGETVVVRKAKGEGVEETRPVSNGEINRELAILKRAFNLALQSGKLLHKPHVPMLREGPARRGFFEREQFQAVLPRLPEALRPIVEFAYITGWRISSEVLPLEWRQIDFAAGEVRLYAGTTKNGEGRVFPMTSRLRALLEAQRDATRQIERERGKIIAPVFHRHGERVRSFKKAFATACRLAGCPGRIPHDFRRTAVRNLELSGVARSVAMAMVGHKTESIYRRYAIVDAGALRDAAAKLDHVADGHAMGMQAKTASQA